MTHGTCYNVVCAQLVATWGELTPWPGTGETLQLLQSKGIFLAPLSNGDYATLLHAVKVFLPQANLTHTVFSSDYPVGAFKPAAAIYAQVTARRGREERRLSWLWLGLGLGMLSCRRR